MLLWTLKTLFKQIVSFGNSIYFFFFAQIYFMLLTDREEGRGNISFLEYVVKKLNVLSIIPQF